MALKEKRFDDIETIQSNATRELKAIPKSAFQDCFKMWKNRWERVVQSNGNYFEGCHGPDGEEYHQRGDMNAVRILFGHTSYMKYILVKTWIFRIYFAYISL